MNTPPQRANIDALHPSTHKYRVMKGNKIIGQFSNIKLAVDRAHDHPGSVVLDLAEDPPKVVHRRPSIAPKRLMNRL